MREGVQVSAIERMRARLCVCERVSLSEGVRVRECKCE